MTWARYPRPACPLVSAATVLDTGMPPEPAPADLVGVRDVIKTFGDKLALNGVSFARPIGADLRAARPQRRRQDHAVPAADGHPEGRRTAPSLVDGPRRLRGPRRGQAADRLPPRRAGVLFLPLRPETLALSAAMHGLDVAATMERVAPLMAQMRLTDDIDNFAEDYLARHEEEARPAARAAAPAETAGAGRADQWARRRIDASVLRHDLGAGARRARRCCSPPI